MLAEGQDGDLEMIFFDEVIGVERSARRRAWRGLGEDHGGEGEDEVVSWFCFYNQPARAKRLLVTVCQAAVDVA